jgi:polysaccharide biosynthesis protein PelE
MSAFSRGLAALCCELVALGLALRSGEAGSYLALHAAASVIVAVLLWPLLSGRPDRRGAFLFVFCMNFFLPVVGVLGLLASLLSRRSSGTAPRRRFEVHAQPNFDPRLEELPPAHSKSAVRMHLRNAAVPTESRLRALLTVQSMPARTANPLIREMLSDPSEDLRLIAYGILDTREKNINARIHAATRELTESPQAQRAALHKQVAELYCELIHQGLVHGGLREHAAGQARQHLERAMALDSADPSMHALMAQIALSAGDYGAAHAALQRALALGLPEPRVLPYLAEVAFQTRRFDEVRSIAARLAAQPDTQGSDRVMQYWRAV